ncbi:urease accessory protein UreD [Gordonia sp. TBRC 11910]|uniref:Urease accessory protein UreD n=1 Tax=Gordonia asplenii TaxID=2725283 RepID=A0A848KQ81_9ACTN|nr:urease accessory protein UreD [Gordonia asplenii]NMO00107.1 urease accessory protein UreD [Gordonia asplenii]
MQVTRVAIRAGEQVAAVELVAGLIVPRLISRTASSAEVALVAGGALLLGGDRVDIEITVGAGCRLELADVGGTVAYDAQGDPSSWSVRIVVDDTASLYWHGLPMVVADGADVERSTRMALAPNAHAVLRETVVLGRSGEVGGRLRTRTDVERGGVPVVVESVEVRPGRREPGVLGAHRVLDTVLAVGFRPPVGAADLRLEQPGALARFLGSQTHRSELDEVWRRWRDAAGVVDGGVGGGDATGVVDGGVGADCATAS